MSTRSERGICDNKKFQQWIIDLLDSCNDTVRVEIVAEEVGDEKHSTVQITLHDLPVSFAGLQFKKI